MKKYLLLILVLFMAFAPFAKAENIYGFMDGKFYNDKAVLKYYCFMDGNCYDLNMKLAPIKFTPIIWNQPATPNVIATPTVSKPYDACPNIDETQNVEPIGMVTQNGNCVYPIVSNLTCSQQLSQANQDLFNLKLKFEKDKAMLDPQASSVALVSLTDTYNSESLRFTYLINQLAAKLTCKD